MKSYTYLGTADDVVRRYPWKKGGWNLNSINNQIIHSVIYDQKLVLNDGYLVANPEFLNSLDKLSSSLLGNAFDTGSMVLFCRSSPRNLAEGISKSAEKIKTHQHALKGKRGRQIINNLEKLQRLVKQTPIPWPKDKNTSAIFATLLKNLHKKNAISWSLASKNSKEDFLKIYKRFENDMDVNFNQARQHWERLCWEELANLDIHKFDDPFDKALQRHEQYERVRTQMQVANEAYHVAYTAAMHWSMKSSEGNGKIASRPLTAFCPAYIDLFSKELIVDEKVLRYEGFGDLLITVDLLKFKRRGGDFSWLRSIAWDSDFLDLRTAYINHLEDYLHYRCEHDQARQVAEAYRNKLARLIAEKVPTISDVGEALVNFFGGAQVISALQAIEGLANTSNMMEPVNLDPIRAVKKIIETREISKKLSEQGIESTIFEREKILARDLGLINATLDPAKVERLLGPIKKYDPNAN